MLLEKIRRLALEWGKTPQALEAVARESLLYGMRIETKPKNLKLELKRVGIDSKLATPLWSGDYYLLLVLPQVLINKKIKIPCLEDLQFAKRILKRAHLSALKQRFKNLPSTTREEVFKKILPIIKKESYRGRYLTQFDYMYEKKEDIQQDIICKALTILNKEWTHFNTSDPDKITNYLSYCIARKTNTYLASTSPKMRRAHVEDEEDLEILVNHHLDKDFESDDIKSTHQLRNDLSRMLPPRTFKAVSLLLGFADPKHETKFEKSLRARGLRRQQLSCSKLKLLIERHLGIEVFSDLKQSLDLRQYLRG